MTNKDETLTRRARHDVRLKNIKIYIERISSMGVSMTKDGLRYPFIQGLILLVVTSESIDTLKLCVLGRDTCRQLPRILGQNKGDQSIPTAILA